MIDFVKKFCKHNAHNLLQEKSANSRVQKYYATISNCNDVLRITYINNSSHIFQFKSQKIQYKLSYSFQLYFITCKNNDCNIHFHPLQCARCSKHLKPSDNLYILFYVTRCKTRFFALLTRLKMIIRASQFYFCHDT